MFGLRHIVVGLLASLRVLVLQDQVQGVRVIKQHPELGVLHSPQDVGEKDGLSEPPSFSAGAVMRGGRWRESFVNVVR